MGSRSTPCSIQISPGAVKSWNNLPRSPIMVSLPWVVTPAVGTSVVAFDGVGRVNQTVNLGWVIEERGEIFPVVLARFDRNGVLLVPRFTQFQQVRVPTGRGFFAGAGLIDPLQISHKCLAVLPGHI